MRTLDKYPRESLCGSDYYYSYYLLSKVNACLFFIFFKSRVYVNKVFSIHCKQSCLFSS